MILQSQEIHLWLAFDREIDDEQTLREFAALLEPAERARAEQLRAEHLPRQYLVTRAMQRSVLSAYAPQVQPAEWRFVSGEHGRPALAPQFDVLGLHFNLAHTSRLVAMAVAREPVVGVDVEHLSARIAPLVLAPRYFTPDEARALALLPVEQQARRFYALWTLKESWLKATGRGLSAGLGNVSFALGDDHRLKRFAVAGDDPGHWHFWQDWPSPEHVLALALRREAPPGTVHVQTRRFTSRWFASGEEQGTQA